MVRLFTFMLLSVVTVVPLVASQSAKLVSSAAETTTVSARAPRVEWATVKGEVELEPAEAYVSAEKRAIEFLWDRFSPEWLARAGSFVPKDRVASVVRSWLENNFETFALVRDKATAVTETTVGKSYRTQFEIQVRGPDAQRFRSAGAHTVGHLARKFHERYLAIAVLFFVVMLVAGRVDRMTRGFLTKRIRFAAILVATAGGWLLLP